MTSAHGCPRTLTATAQLHRLATTSRARGLRDGIHSLRTGLDGGRRHHDSAPWGRYRLKSRPRRQRRRLPQVRRRSRFRTMSWRNWSRASRSIRTIWWRVICAASLFPLQIVEAQRFLEKRAKDKSLQPKDTWDGSVISLLNYPEVVTMMSGDLEWTQALGDALANQQKEVLIAIQQLRDEAVAKDIIKSDDKIQVVSLGDNVIIQSTNPETIYVPRYEPRMLYVPDYRPAAHLLLRRSLPQLLLPDRGFLGGRGDRRLIWGCRRLGRWHLGRQLGRRRRRRLQQLPEQHQRQGQLEGRRLEERRPLQAQFRPRPIGQYRQDEDQNGLQGDRANSLKSKADNVRRERTGNLSDRASQARDIRKSALDRSAKGDRATAPGQGDRPKAATRPAGQRNAANRSAGQRKAANRPSGKPKAGARADRRPNKPTGIGNPSRGKATKVSSNRGRQSIGGGSSRRRARRAAAVAAARRAWRRPAWRRRHAWRRPWRWRRSLALTEPRIDEMTSLLPIMSPQFARWPASLRASLSPDRQRSRAGSRDQAPEVSPGTDTADQQSEAEAIDCPRSPPSTSRRRSTIPARPSRLSRRRWPPTTWRHSPSCWDWMSTS